MHAVSGARSARVPRGSVSRKASSHDVRRSPSDVVKERHRREETVDPFSFIYLIFFFRPLTIANRRVMHVAKEEATVLLNYLRFVCHV